jgi:hypothetical protein
MATFRFIFEPSEYGRIIPAVCIDARASIPAIKNAIGDVIKAYTDAEVEKVIPSVLFFRIETIKDSPESADGVLAGYFSLKLKGALPVPILYQFQLRTPFYSYSTAINAKINVFLSSNEWRQYYL